MIEGGDEARELGAHGAEGQVPRERRRPQGGVVEGACC